jgi:hypothetical protein
MPWPCYFIEEPPLCSFEHDGKIYHYVDTRGMRVGAMWYSRGDDGKIIDEATRRAWNLADHYWAHNAQRPPLYVALPCVYSTGPGLQVFGVDWKCYSKEQGHYGGWQVSGAPPAITVQPSINIVGSYHGWLQNGVVSEDCEGRVYAGLPR